ncbi:hypothetical protein [Tautonia sociabilis]|uniref:DoxX family protein n=1 Tax=Tautonia sociabilis TaxID=2080755 RepID=A0A432ME24_9BACT|nr:hypothetical protein [Tautonia sociabilis]RUL83396.1 hypothetical protein TsocGM_22350 [Tautonia sociabilis]
MRPSESIALRREPGHLVRSLSALLLRGALGMIFLVAGLDKLSDMGLLGLGDAGASVVAAQEEALPAVEGAPAGEAAPEPEPEGEDAQPAPLRYPETIRAMFADTWLARELKPMLDLHTALLPYAEVAVGSLLIVGLLTTLSSFAAGLLLLSLLFGLTVLGKGDMYPTMMVYMIADVGILWLSPVTSNYLSLDGLLFGWFWKPREEDYRREYEAPVRPRA